MKKQAVKKTSKYISSRASISRKIGAVVNILDEIDIWHMTPGDTTLFVDEVNETLRSIAIEMMDMKS
jgi:hypothetical protein